MQEKPKSNENYKQPTRPTNLHIHNMQVYINIIQSINRTEATEELTNENRYNKISVNSLEVTRKYIDTKFPQLAIF